MAQEMTFKNYYLDDYIVSSKEDKNIDFNRNATLDKNARFHDICNAIKKYFEQEWDRELGNKSNNSEIILDRQKKAIIGYTTEVNYFKDKIREFLKTNNMLHEWHPSWYENIVDAIFHENWGLAGIAKWKLMPDCPSAKIIGDRIYYLINGKLVLQEQRISKDRYEQLRKALLLKTPKVRLDSDYVEVYMLSGERISIYSGDVVKEGQACMVFRKYIVKNYTFEEQANRRTIPYESIPMFKAMVALGYRVAIIGAVRTGKTTFLTTWQQYEDPSLEGVMIETDPEIPLHVIMPNAPIMQLLADDEKLDTIIKSVLRSDADYIIAAEARDGRAYNMAVKIANKGTRRVKLTAHLSDPIDFCYDVANEIISIYGGKLDYHIIKTAKSFDYIFQFVQLKDKSQKRLKGIYEIRYNREDHSITIHQICKYNYETDSWTYKFDIGADKEEIAMEEDINAYKIFTSELKKLSELYPMKENNVFHPFYGKGGDN